MPGDVLPLIDDSKLDNATHGDRALQVEVLALFIAEVERLMRQVEHAEDPQVRGERLKALVGVAQNTGAVLLAQEARLALQRITSDEPDFTSLSEAVDRTLAYVRQGRS